MKFYKSLEILIKDEKENSSYILSDQIRNDSIYLNWNYEKLVKNNKHIVIVEVVENHTNERFDEINEFINLIYKNKDIIQEFQEGDLCLRINYEYDDQCNLEFLPAQLKKLGDLGVVLCISCWEKNR
ncbi:MAG: hypothetical protein MH472_11590 [Bacteroidia bacterium]|nr:hypothetical protein [Bacteroidia bacterium]